MPLGDRGTTAEGRSEIDRLAQACPGKLEDVETLSGLCLLFRRSLLEEVPGFDAAFGLGNFEDDDFCLRVRLCGHRLVIARDAFVHHHGHRTFQALGIDYQAAIRDRQETFTKKWQHDAAGTRSSRVLRATGARPRPRPAEPCTSVRPGPDAHFLLGRILASRGESAAAILHLQAFLARCPHHGEAAVLLGLQQLRQGESARGLETLRHAFADLWIGDTLGAMALAQLARWCLDHKRLGEAVAHATDALELLPDDAGLRNLLGVTLMESGDLTRAEATFHSAVALANQDAKKNLGVCLWRQGQIGPALRAMAEAVAEHPGDSQALANLRQARAAAELVTDTDPDAAPDDPPHDLPDRRVRHPSADRAQPVQDTAPAAADPRARRRPRRRSSRTATSTGSRSRSGQFRQLENADLLGRADVDDAAAGRRAVCQLHECPDHVPDVGEAPRLLAVAVDGQRLPRRAWATNLGNTMPCSTRCRTPTTLKSRTTAIFALRSRTHASAIASPSSLLHA